MADTEPSVDTEKGLAEIVHTEGVLGGDPRLDGRRIGVRHGYQRYVEAGDSPKAIAEQYDRSLPEVHAVLAYAFNHPDEIEALERRDRGIAEATASNRRRPVDVE